MKKITILFFFSLFSLLACNQNKNILITDLKDIISKNNTLSIFIISENQNKSSYSVEIVFQNSSEVFYIIDGDNIEDLYTFAKTNNITISGNVSNSSLHITIITILPFLIILLAYLIFILIVILTPFKDKKSKFILILLSVFLPIIGFIIFLIFSKKYNK